MPHRSLTASRTRTLGFALRWTEDESRRIRERAAAAGMPVGPYLIACALGDTESTPTVEQRLDDLQRRVERLEQKEGPPVAGEPFTDLN